MDEFRNGLAEAENSFLHITQGIVHFLNPSVRDYLDNYFPQGQSLKFILANLEYLKEAQEAWKFFEAHDDELSGTPSDHADWFALGAERLVELSSFERVKTERGLAEISPIGGAVQERLALVLDWWQRFGSDQLAHIALELARHLNTIPIEDTYIYLHTDLLGSLRSEELSDLPHRAEINKAVRSSLFDRTLAEWTPSIDELDYLIDYLEKFGEELVEDEAERLEEQVKIAISYAYDEAVDMTSSSEIQDLLDQMECIADYMGVSISSQRDQLAEILEEVQMQEDHQEDYGEYYRHSMSSDYGDSENAELHSIFSGLPLERNQKSV